MRLNEVFPSKFLKAEDLADGIGGYRRVTVQIRETVMQDLGDERKAIVYFRGKDKGLVLNRTNADELQTITGSDDTDQWNGYRVMLFVERVPFQGKKVPALRICAAEQAPAQAAPPRAAQAPPYRVPQPQTQPPASLAGGWREAPPRPPTPAAPPPVQAAPPSRRHPYQPEPEPEPEPAAGWGDSEPDSGWGAAEAAAEREPGSDDDIPF